MLSQLLALVIATVFSALPIDAPVLEANQSKPVGIWIDVRTPMEHRQGALKDSLNIPVQIIDDEITQAVPDLDAPIYVYCRSGNRSRIAAEILHNKGYKNVINYGGYEELKSKGYQ